MYTAIWAPRSMSQPSNEGNSTMPLPACLSVVGCFWTAGNSDAVVCCYRPFPWNLRWMPWTSLGFMLEQATQRHRHLSTMFHVTTQHRGKQHTRLRTIFWFEKLCPSGLLCVESPAKGISRGPSLSSLMDGQRRGQWWGLQTYLGPSTFGHGQVAKP